MGRGRGEEGERGRERRGGKMREDFFHFRFDDL